MPYARNADLPKSVRDHLPQDAQTIYRKAYNNAWQEYERRERRRGSSASREETAHRVAWAAVKSSFGKRGGRWVRIRERS
jgi:cation transport regulator